MKRFLLVFIFMHTFCIGDIPRSKVIKVAVFCSGDNNIDLQLKVDAYSFGQYLGNNNFGLISGGGNSGLMKEVIDGYATTANSLQNCKGILMQAYASNIDDCHPALNKENIILVETLHNRLDYFQSTADVFIALPGGFGTLHEIIDCLAHNKHMNKSIILLNMDGFWNNLIQQFKIIITSNPAAATKLVNFIVVDSFSECIQLLNHKFYADNISYCTTISAIAGK